MGMPNFTKFTMHNYRLVVFFILLLISGGLASVMFIPKQEFPEFKMAIGMLVAVYPGAPADEVEKQVSCRLEEYLVSFPEVESRKLETTSSDGMCVIKMELNDEGAKNPNAVWGRIRDGLPLLQKTVGHFEHL